MFRLAARNLIENKARLVISVAGVGLALTLVLFFAAVFAGAQGRLTAYIDHSGADVWVSQEGVRTMHMSESALPSSMTGQVQDVPGVEQAVPIMYAESMVQAKGDDYIAYVFGIDPGAPFGGPWRIVDGASTPGPGEVIIDRAIARRSGVGTGDRVTVLGREMTIAGLTAGTSSLASSVTFIRMEDFAAARGGGEVVSFVLVKVAPGESVQAVASRIAEAAPDVTVQTRVEFASEERAFVGDMSADIISIMNLAGYLTGLAVVALTIYIATVGHRREYGVLKAMGVRNSYLYRVVLVQALMSVLAGLAVGLSITLALSVLIPQFNELIVLSVSIGALLQVTLVALVLGGVAALLPARQIAGLEPVAVLRGSRS